MDRRKTQTYLVQLDVPKNGVSGDIEIMQLLKNAVTTALTERRVNNPDAPRILINSIRKR